MQIALLFWLVEVLENPVVLDLLISRQLLFKENQRMHFLVEISALVVFTQPKVFALELELFCPRALFVIFKVVNLLLDIFFLVYFC